MEDEIKGNQIHETQVNSTSMNQHYKSQSFRKVVKALKFSTNKKIIERWHVHLWHVHYDTIKKMQDKGMVIGSKWHITIA